MDRIPRLASELFRVNVASAVALAVTMVAFLPSMSSLVRRLDEYESAREWLRVYFGELTVPIVLVFWVIFAIVHIVLTHRAFSRMTPIDLRRVAAVQVRSRGRWWRAMVGDVSAESWTVQGALVAAVGVLAIAQTDQFRSSTWMLLLGLASVAGSWALMIYAYATRYMRLDVGRRVLEFDLLSEPRYRDYLTLSVLTSTMQGAGVRCRTSESWSVMRTHSMLAFAFNTVIVAMTVSLLVGGLGSIGI
ncbi:DUF1345 domain-containing protein [Georgenia sp. Z1491]|uniref:DUF1345 domain-containing protein n=1 Tax=Georgenia sp. Z1491 TaxID=3416707 RepID=UPI003CF956BA